MSLTRKGNTAQFLSNYGTLVRDRYGVDSATAVWINTNKAVAPDIPGPGSPHPLWTYMTLDKVQASDEESFWRIEATYAGVYGSPAAVYDLDLSTAEEPIDSHPDFVDTLGGTVASPLNGAVFDSDGLFKNFPPSSGPGYAGCRSYLAPGACWRQSTVSSGGPSDISEVGHIDSPPGSPPTVESGRNWLYTGVTYEKRGAVYVIRKEWRLSGRNGWNTDIYS